MEKSLAEIKAELEARDFRRYYPSIAGAFVSAFGDGKFVTHIGPKEMPRCDMKNKVMYLPEVEAANYKDLIHARGLLAHELGHIRDTMPMTKLDIDTQILMRLLNIVEDARIDLNCMSDYPVMGQDLVVMWEDICESRKKEDLMAAGPEGWIMDLSMSYYGYYGLGRDIKVNPDNPFVECFDIYRPMKNTKDALAIAKEMLEKIKSLIPPELLEKMKKEMEGEGKEGDGEESDEEGKEGKKGKAGGKGKPGKKAEAQEEGEGKGEGKAEKSTKDAKDGKKGTDGGSDYRPSSREDEADEDPKAGSKAEEDEKAEKGAELTAKEKADTVDKLLEELAKGEYSVSGLIKENLKKRGFVEGGAGKYTFHTAEDRQQVASTSGVSTTTEVTKLWNDCAGISRQVQNAFIRMKKQEAPVSARNQKSGRFDPSVVYRILQDDVALFEKKIRMEHRSLAVNILLDCSGSMSGRKIKIAIQSAILLVKALQGIDPQIAIEVSGFTTRDWYSPKIGDVRRTIPLLHMIFKPFEEKGVALLMKRMEPLMTDGILKHNIDGEAVEWAYLRLLQRKEEKKVLIVLSDGYPEDGGDSKSLNQDLKERVRKIIKQKMVEIAGIGICTDSVKQFYPDSQVIDEIDKLPKALFEVLGRKI